MFRFIALSLPFLVFLLFFAELSSFIAPTIAPLAAIVLALFDALGVTQRIPKVIDWISFLLGVAVSALTGLFYFRLMNWHHTAGAPDRPQSVVLTTKETPNQVSGTACRAQCSYLATIVFLVLVLLLLVSVPFSSYLGGLFRMILTGIRSP